MVFASLIKCENDDTIGQKEGFSFLLSLQIARSYLIYVQYFYL
jgi:hypothetical protein